MGIKEYGQAAGEVELQDNPGPIKNQEGESIVEVTNDGKFRVLNESDSTQNLEMSVLSDGNPVLDMNGSTGGIAFLRSTAAYSLLQFQNPVTGQADNVSDGLTVGCSSRNGIVRMRNNAENDATLTIGVNDSDAITIDASKNATFVANLSANGNVTLGDASGDTHTVNGTMTFANGINVDAINDASGDAAITIDATANLTFNNNVTVSGTMNMPATVTLPNTANGSVTTSDVAVDANGKDLTIAAGSTTGGSGTNNTGTGGDLTIKPGAGKGTAAGGDVIVQTAPAGASGTTINNYSTQMIVKESGNVGMGSTTPRRTLDVLDASNPQVRLSHTDDTHFADMQVAGTGALTVANSGGAITLDSAGDVELDSGSANATMKLLSAGSEKASLDSTSDDISLTVATADKDFNIKGTDGSSAVTAFTIDFSEAGRAIFNNNIRLGGNVIEASDGGSTITLDTSDNVTIAGNVQVGGNSVKDSGGNAALTFDGSGNISNDVVVTGSLAYKPKVISASSANTDLTTAQSGATVLLSGSGTARLPAITTSASVGIQYVIVNTTTSTISGAIVRDAGNTASFFDSDTTSGETASQDVEAMKAKTCICIDANKWLVIG